jgi:hypothetical protein
VIFRSNRHLLNAALMARFCTILLEILSSTRQGWQETQQMVVHSGPALHDTLLYISKQRLIMRGRQRCEPGNFNRSNPSIPTATPGSNIWVFRARCVVIFQRCCASMCSTACPSHHIPVVPAAIPFADAVVGYHMLPRPIKR